MPLCCSAGLAAGKLGTAESAGCSCRSEEKRRYSGRLSYMDTEIANSRRLGAALCRNGKARSR